MGKDRSMAIKHAKAKKEAMKEVLNDQNDFAQTSWGLTDNMRKWFKAKPYAICIDIWEIKMIALEKSQIICYL